MLSRTQFLKVLRSRHPKGLSIGLASFYLRAFALGAEKGFAKSASADRLLGNGTSYAFRQALKASESQPVYTGAVLKPGDLSEKAKALLRKEKESGSDLKACMKFEGVLTTTRKDRDGDVLESKGAKLDPAMPLLWQHNPCLPIGKHLGVTKRNDDLVKGLLAIADIPLGRDAAELVQFGALRISHGFNPEVFEPLEGEEQRGFPGWHVKEFEMCEVSLVSIPSNVDAVITAWSRKKLATPLMKAWARSLYEKGGQRVVSGWDKNGASKNGASTKAQGTGAVTVNLHVGGEKKGATDSFGKLESLVEKAIAASKKGPAKGSFKGPMGGDDYGNDDEDMAGYDEDEEKADGEEEDEGQEEEESTLLEQIRGELQDLMDSGELPDERVSQVYNLIISVSEAIGAQRHETEMAGEESDKDDNWDMFDRDEEIDDPGSEENEIKDDPELDETEDDERRDEEDEDPYMEDGDDEEEDAVPNKPSRKPSKEEEDGEKGPRCRDDEMDEDEEKAVGEDQPGWDGQDTDDENTGLNGPPKGGRSHALATDAADYLALELAVGRRPSAASVRKLRAALDRLD